MSGLVLKLGPKERVLVNGAVLENGDRRTRVAIMTPGANILRLRDAIHPDDANTPVRRVCYAVQLVLSGDSDAEAARLPLLRHIEELSRILTDPDSRAHLARATDAILEDEHYKCLKSLRALLPREARLLARATA
ncbi:flagellar biosynthesis repressor FlbT [Roseovarius sp. SCSIO 43702]|uniref:flagellar biosynthesis repressor FlbT n=1 Tax=Roseovarius sp. SCSIO 43702 TaxID=2823043 RepID=UPI001C73CB92|nr:flagellar biosynthesis repressor FlbT [Roseovarius sp. SCSIO 43702]QYX57103.1 flagellar biosynthesis repressor FlbT [Roseovarius sp. SCSIO 43702]